MMLSGGLDSTVAAFLAAESLDPVVGITFDYGQKAHRRELGAGYRVSHALGVQHRTVFLPFFRELGCGALLEAQKAPPQPSDADLDDTEGAARDSAASVWVPNRNGILIAVGAAWAERLEADVLVVGFNAEEAATFPDNSEDFLRRQNEALAYSTRNGVRVESPTSAWTKQEIVARAMEKDMPLEFVWPCYLGEDDPCGRCESCRRFERAVDAAGARSWLDARRREMP